MSKPDAGIENILMEGEPAGLHYFDSYIEAICLVFPISTMYHLTGLTMANHPFLLCNAGTQRMSLPCQSKNKK